ncbi:MAG: hypothetical protein EA350_15055 [Gemmatimonadales bacterium]|nr:MAG: hypothetical protein EA350_15055 [Gemmatimonadales bacterium]
MSVHHARQGARAALLGTLLLGLAACASLRPAGESTDADHGIEVLLAAPDRPYEVLVDLRADGLLLREIPRARERILVEAAATGGDAVILYTHEGSEVAGQAPTYTRVEITGRQRSTEARAGMVHARVIVWK